jgi:hypothetical protein
MSNDAARALRVDEDLLDRPYERKFERPSRAYGTHRRDTAPVHRVTGPQPGRRTVEIRGQVQAPRRRSQTQAAFVARPDRSRITSERGVGCVSRGSCSLIRRLYLLPVSYVQRVKR